MNNLGAKATTPHFTSSTWAPTNPYAPTASCMFVTAASLPQPPTRASPRGSGRTHNASPAKEGASRDRREQNLSLNYERFGSAQFGFLTCASTPLK